MQPHPKPASHTPGPWHIMPNTDGLRVTSESHKRAYRNRTAPSGTVLPVADCGCVYDRWVEKSEQRANARLIAAAPELLEALQALLNEMRTTHDDAFDYSKSELEAIGYAETVILKATKAP